MIHPANDNHNKENEFPVQLGIFLSSPDNRNTQAVKSATKRGKIVTDFPVKTSEVQWDRYLEDHDIFTQDESNASMLVSPLLVDYMRRSHGLDKSVSKLETRLSISRRGCGFVNSEDITAAIEYDTLDGYRSTLQDDECERLSPNGLKPMHLSEDSEVFKMDTAEDRHNFCTSEPKAMYTTVAHFLDGSIDHSLGLESLQSRDSIETSVNDDAGIRFSLPSNEQKIDLEPTKDEDCIVRESEIDAPYKHTSQLDDSLDDYDRQRNDIITGCIDVSHNVSAGSMRQVAPVKVTDVNDDSLMTGNLANMSGDDLHLSPCSDTTQFIDDSHDRSSDTGDSKYIEFPSAKKVLKRDDGITVYSIDARNAPTELFPMESTVRVDDDFIYDLNAVISITSTESHNEPAMRQDGLSLGYLKQNACQFDPIQSQESPCISLISDPLDRQERQSMSLESCAQHSPMVLCKNGSASPVDDAKSSSDATDFSLSCDIIPQIHYQVLSPSDTFLLSPLHQGDSTSDRTFNTAKHTPNSIHDSYFSESHNLSSAKKRLNVQSNSLWKELTGAIQRRTLNLAWAQDGTGSKRQEALIRANGVESPEMSQNVSRVSAVATFTPHSQKDVKINKDNDWKRDIYKPFKALPMPTSTMDSSGLSGVPKICKKLVTIPVSPCLGAHRKDKKTNSVRESHISRQIKTIQSQRTVELRGEMHPCRIGELVTEKTFHADRAEHASSVLALEIQQHDDYTPSKESVLCGLEFLKDSPVPLCSDIEGRTISTMPKGFNGFRSSLKHLTLEGTDLTTEIQTRSHTAPYLAGTTTSLNLHTARRSIERAQFEKKRLENEQILRERREKELDRTIREKRAELERLKDTLR